MNKHAAPLALASVLLAACGGSRGQNAGRLAAEAPPASCSSDDRLAGRCPKLSDYGLFLGTGSDQRPAGDVIPYDVIAPLFSDFARKHRFLYLPAGVKIAYDATGAWKL